jgi:hypothetical protein
MARDTTCKVPECTAKTLRDYCVRCSVNGHARAHARQAEESKSA